MSKIKTIANFRDLGGMATKHGVPVKARKLLRSGELYQISTTDKQILAGEYQVRLVVDFRNASETAAAPDDAVAGCTYLHINVMKELDHFNTGLDDLIRRVDQAGVDNDMKQVYENLALNESARQEFGRFIRKTAELELGSCLFHCFAGKDRTGVAAALLLEILGVSREDILDDYLKTNSLRQDTNRVILDEALKNGMSPAQADVLEQLLLVKKDYLVHMYDAIDHHYENFDDYLCSGLGVREMDKELLKKRCLAH